MDIDDARILARQLMDQHGLHRWSLVFGQAQTYFGLCYKRQKRITISAPLTLLNDIDEVRDVILHEIAHAGAIESPAGDAIRNLILPALSSGRGRNHGCDPRRGGPLYSTLAGWHRDVRDRPPARHPA
jgi:SprT-like family